MKLYKISFSNKPNNSDYGYIIRANDKHHALNILFENNFYGVSGARWIFTSPNIVCEEIDVLGDPGIILAAGL